MKYFLSIFLAVAITGLQYTIFQMELNETLAILIGVNLIASFQFLNQAEKDHHLHSKDTEKIVYHNDDKPHLYQ